MSTTSKLEYLNNTKEMLKNRLNSLGAEITNSITFRNYLTWLDNFYTGSANKTDIAINGIDGRTSQSGTPTPDSPQPINNLSGNVSYTVSGANIETRTFTIPLGNIALNNIDGYIDNIHSENGKFYLHKETEIHILNGSENWTFSNSPSTPTPRTVAYIIHTDSDYSKRYYSNRFVYGDTSTSNRLVINSNARWNVSLDNTLTGITSSDTNAQKLEKIKTYISNNNIEVDYVLLTPTTTEITNSNYPALYSALKEIQDYLTSYKINKEFILEYSSPEIEY